MACFRVNFAFTFSPVLNLNTIRPTVWPLMPGEEQADKQTGIVCPVNVMSSLNKQRLIKNHLEGFVTPSSHRTHSSYSYLLVINLQILLSRPHRGRWRNRHPFRCARITPRFCLASSRETRRLPSGQCPCIKTQCCYLLGARGGAVG